jgi:hypothetical protein
MAKRRGLDKHSRKHTGEASHKAVGDLPMAAQRHSTPTLVRCLTPLQRLRSFESCVRVTADKCLPAIRSCSKPQVDRRPLRPGGGRHWQYALASTGMRPNVRSRHVVNKCSRPKSPRPAPLLLQHNPGKSATNRR